MALITSNIAEAQKILYGAEADKQEGANRKWNADFEARPEVRMYDQTIKRALQGTSLINNAVDVINPFRWAKGILGNKGGGGTVQEHYGPLGEHTGTIYKRNLP